MITSNLLEYSLLLVDISLILAAVLPAGLSPTDYAAIFVPRESSGKFFISGWFIYIFRSWYKSVVSGLTVLAKWPHTVWPCDHCFEFKRRRNIFII